MFVIFRSSTRIMSNRHAQVDADRLAVTGCGHRRGDHGEGAITTLRCQQASRPEDRIWQPRHNQAVPA
jgi:hypothetical protein